MISTRVSLSSLRFVSGFWVVFCCALAGSLWGGFFYVSIFLGAIISLVYIRHSLSNLHRFTPYTALAINFLLGYLVGPSVAVWYYMRPHENSPILLSGPFAFVGNTAVFSLGIAFAVFVVIELILLSEFVSNRLMSDLHGFECGSKLRGGIFVVIITLIVVYALKSGDIGYMGVQVVSGGGRITILGGLAGSILTAIPAVFSAKALRVESGKLGVLFYLILAIVFLGVVSITGRRFLVISALSAVVVVFYFRPGIEKSIRFSRLNKVRLSTWLAVILAGLFVWSGMKYFYALRVATRGLGDEQSLVVRLSSAWGIFLQDSQGEGEYGAQSETRSGTLPGYLGALVDSPGESLSGVCFVHAVANSIPALLFPNKSDFVNKYSCSDERVNALHGLTVIDSPTTILTQSYADYGYFGAVLYVAVIGFMFFVVPFLVKIDGSRDFSVFAVSLALNTLLYPEQGLSFYFVSLRNLIIIFFISLSLKFVLNVSLWRHKI